nr:immunoglobulin heavy chain junction region [Mus musculus]
CTRGLRYYYAMDYW